MRHVTVVVTMGVATAACGFVKDTVEETVDDTVATLPPLIEPSPSTAPTRPTRAPSPNPRKANAAPTSPISSIPAPSTSPPTTATTTAPTTTVDPAHPPEVDVAAYAVLDVTANRWMAEHEADTPRAVGSMMKLLSAYVVMQHGDRDRTVTVPAPSGLGMADGESKFGLYEGERASREVLLRLMLIASAGDAARVLAIDTAGSQEAFVNEMNATAAALGMTGTFTDNPVGLDGAGSHSTAHDMALLAANLLQDPGFRQTVARTSVEWQAQTRDSTNSAFLTSYPGAVGVKTGYTTSAEYCLTAAAERDGRLLIAVVLGAPTSGARTDAVTALLDWGFRPT